MENWIFLFLGLILAYLLEFTRPWVKSAYNKSVFSSRKKRLDTIYKEYQTMKLYKENPVEFYHKAIRTIFVGLAETVALIVVVGVDVLLVLSDTRDVTIMAIAITVGYGFSAYHTFRSFYYMMDDIKNFNDYQARIIDKLKKLGGNPEDLDKEEG